MSRSRCRHTLALIVLLLPFATAPRDASARVREQVSASPTIAPTPIAPPAGVRVDEGSARFELSPGTGVADVRVVVARFPFETSGWSSLPSGPAWTVVPYGARPIELQS